MIIRILTIAILFGVLSHTRNGAASEKTIWTIIEEMKKKDSDSPGLCPSGIGARSGDEPKLEVTAPNNMKLILCGYSSESEFDIYSVDSNNAVSSAIVTYGALDHVKAYAKGGALVIDELISYKESWIPAFRKEISCKTSKCELGSPLCIFEKPITANKDLSEIRSYQTGENKDKYPDEMIIQEVFDMALAGNKEAQNILLNSQDSLKLDGASAEVFSSSADTIKRLKSANCL